MSRKRAVNGIPIVCTKKAKQEEKLTEYFEKLYKKISDKDFVLYNVTENLDNPNKNFIDFSGERCVWITSRPIEYLASFGLNLKDITNLYKLNLYDNMSTYVAHCILCKHHVNTIHTGPGKDVPLNYDIRSTLFKEKLQECVIDHCSQSRVPIESYRRYVVEGTFWKIIKEWESLSTEEIRMAIEDPKLSIQRVRLMYLERTQPPPKSPNDGTEEDEEEEEEYESD